MISASKGSVLSRQKPRRLNRARFSLSGFLSRHLKLAICCAAICGISVLILNIRRKPSHIQSMSVEDSVDWQVDLHIDSGFPLTEKKTEDLIRSAKSVMRFGDIRELETIATTIQKIEVFSQVSVLKLSDTRILVSVKPRVPIMCIDFDRPRLVSNSGEVYGYADTEGSPPCPTPKLIGVRNKNTKATSLSDLTIALEANEKQIINNAINLVDSAKVNGFSFSTIEYREHRGFIVQMSGLETLIFLGYPPFEDKLKKLSSLLKRIASKGESASRIELDYMGKAFVKLKKL